MFVAFVALGAFKAFQNVKARFMSFKRTGPVSDCQLEGAANIGASGAPCSVRVGGGIAAGGADAEGGDGRGAGASPFPCLYSNNVTERNGLTDAIVGLASVLSPYHKRQAHALHDNVRRLLALVPSLGHIGFLTLTTPDNCSDADDLRQRWRSCQSHFFTPCPEFGHWLAVDERQRRGAWHKHLLVEVAQDIRQGIDWAALARGDYRSAPPYLRGLWRLLRARLPAYGFGRHELLPVRSSAEAMARYVGKYIGKHMGKRRDEDKGKRLISASRGWPRSSTTFAWHTDHAQTWRRNLGRLARHLGLSDLGGFTDRYGSSWAYHLAEIVRDVDKAIAISPARLDAMLRLKCRCTATDSDGPIAYYDGQPVNQKLVNDWFTEWQARIPF